MTLRLAAPAIAVASLLLVPFLNKPFTIDDPLFLREARHALVDPLHPADFVQVWNAGDRLRLSQYLLGGTLPAYVLAPVAALGSREWIAHLYQFLLLCGFLVASVSVALRWGCNPRQAAIVGMLTACNPVTLAMASTCMPDVMAAMFAMAGLDRLLVFRKARRWGAGLASGLLLGAAVLCRASTVPILLVGALLLLPANWKLAARSLWPLAVAVVAVVALLTLNRGPQGHSALGGVFQSLTSPGNMPRNLVGFLCFQALTGPILLYAVLGSGARFAGIAALLAALGVALSRFSGWAPLVRYAVPASLGICFLLACALVARKLWASVGRTPGSARVPLDPLCAQQVSTSVSDEPTGASAADLGVRPTNDPENPLPLLVWLGCGLIALPYSYMAAKYLLPGVPAAALLIVLHAAQVRQRSYPLVVALLIALGWISGALIVVGDTTLAASQRSAVDRLIVPRLRYGMKVWAAGQWAFLAYAEDAGAVALANTPPLPAPGDIVVLSRLDYYGMLDRMPLHLETVTIHTDERCGVFVLNRALGAGFYSNRFGYLPFAIGCAEVNAYDVYRVLP